MTIIYDRWWTLKNGRFFEETPDNTKEIVEDYLYFPATTTTITTTDLANLPVADIIDKLMDQPGSWSLVYFNAKLKKIFIGRDVFGRQSLVINPELMMIGCRVHPETSKGSWLEVPFGQITVLDLDVSASERNAVIYSYLHDYPEETIENYLTDWNTERIHVDNKKAALLNVSRNSEKEGLSTLNAQLLFEKVSEATKILLRNYCTSHVAVCLSGGVDSTFIAHVAHASTPTEMHIDLINVAFGNSEKECEQAPDRNRARKALDSLRVAYPNRKFRLLLVNVDSETLETYRIASIAPAAQPASTVLDDSLSCVLWFAVRAEGMDSDTGENVKSTATTCLLGSGADELLAGYARHRTRFEKERIVENVAEECENELRRLGSRNGGRDARVAAQLGKTILSPLLEDSVVSWLNSLPVTDKWDLSLPRGIGEKLLLRESVKLLGSPYDAPKQAMQFGSRMAKMSNNGNSAIKGSDKSPHLLK
uniref:Asparagine synthetase domain-containing protein n=1 Tax=Caenorhabditis japonica TaxID=281687 RepID=A0A8R1I5E6_CAEJA